VTEGVNGGQWWSMEAKVSSENLSQAQSGVAYFEADCLSTLLWPLPFVWQRGRLLWPLVF